MSKTLLMIHGVGCGGEVWDRMKRDFAMAGWTCETPTLFPDLRTRENPPDALADLTLSDYVDAAGRRRFQRTVPVRIPVIDTGIEPEFVRDPSAFFRAACNSMRRISQ